MPADGKLYEHIQQRCRELGITPGAVCNEIGIRRAFMTEIKNGRTQYLSAEKIALIADVLNVSCHWLITGEEFHSRLTPEESALLSAWRIASGDEKEAVAFALRKQGFSYEPDKSEEKAV